MSDDTTPSLLELIAELTFVILDVILDLVVRGAFLGAGIASGAILVIRFSKDWGLI